MNHRTRRASAVLCVLILFICAPLAADEPTLEGHWEGTIELPGQELEFDLDFSLHEGAWTGDISIPLQNLSDLPLEKISLDGNKATFAIPGVPGEPTFTGEISEDGKSIGGDFTQGGQTFPFTAATGIDPAVKAAIALEGIDDVIEAALEDWKTPGMSLAVVVGNSVVLAEGYGYRDVENKVPVTADTLFAIGSSSKAFTTFTMGLLVDQGKLDWDEPVASYLADFKLFDEYASAHLTPRDMVCHRSGLPRHDLTWYNNEEITRAELVRRLRYLEPNEDLRAVWQYNNLMFLTAGYLIEQLTGMSWEEAVRTQVFEPLGMQRSNFSVHDSQQDGDHALPYFEEDDVVRKIAFRAINVMGPAGSINSSANDMTRWVKLHLNAGVLDGKPVIQPGTLQEMHSPQMILPGVPEEEWASPVSYGLGWFMDTWRGHYRVHHGGAIDGFSALVTFFPRDNFGVVALVNKSGSPLPNLITSVVADRVLGLEPIEWISEAAEERDTARELGRRAEEQKAMFRVEGTSPSHDLETYAGEFAHDGYGVVEIKVKHEALVMVYNGMTMPLEHWHYDVFNVADVDEELIPENLRANFLTDARGRVATLSLPLETLVDPIQFERRPPRRMYAPDHLARLAGDYLVVNQTFTLSVQGDKLVGRTPGSPGIELVPIGEDEFELKGITGVELRFTVPDAGPATEMILIQAGAVLKAPRKEADETEEDSE
jgi:CubicO group peptidase (beta-lactamase class C family)